MSEVDLRAAGLPGMSPGLYGVLAVPTGEGPWPAVVMVHEAFGLTDVMRRQVDRMASAGFLVLMPDLFVEGGPRKCLRATFSAISSGHGRVFDDVEAARQYLVGRADCTGKVGVLGFCMGGGFALAASAGHGFEAASSNYGRLPGDTSVAFRGACPIVGSYGGRDLSLRGASAKLSEALNDAEVVHDVKEYPTAGHSFLNDAPTGPRALRPVMQAILGAGPDPEAAADAWHRIDAFFHTHLA